MLQSNSRPLRRHSRRLTCGGRTALIVGALVMALCATGARAGEPDCDNNGVPDAEELSGNDCNGNGLLDVCENGLLGPIVEISMGILSLGVTPSVSIEGDRMVVGDSGGHNLDGVGTGKVSILRRQAGVWVIEQVLYGPSIASAFGTRVFLANHRLAVSAPHDMTYGLASRGSVRLFQFNSSASTWEEDGVLAPVQNTFNRRFFGIDLAFDGNHLFVVDEKQQASFPGPRRIHNFRRQGGAWVKRQEIYHSGEDAVNVLNTNLRFLGLGEGVLLTQDYVRVYPNVAAPALCLVIHEFDGNAWVPKARFRVTSAFTGVASPLAAANVTKDRIVACISRDTRFLFVIEKSNGQWAVTAEFTTPDVPGISKFGSWLARDGDRYLVGAQIDDEPVVFELRFEAEAPELFLQGALSGVLDEGMFSGNQFVTGHFEQVLRYFAVSRDCDGNGVLDECEIEDDADGNLVPDACQSDCNQDGIPDGAQLVDADCDSNGVLDACDVDPADPDGDGLVADDCNQNGLPDSCDNHCEGITIPIDCDLDGADPDGDGHVASDCNGNGVPDSCDIVQQVSQLAILQPSDSAGDIQFGKSLATENDLLVVGGPPTGVSGRGGRVYVFRFSEASWIEEAILTSDSNAGDVVFGTRVGISNGRIFVGEENLAASPRLFLHVFENSDGEWGLADSIDMGATGGPRLDLDFAVDGDELVTHTVSQAGVAHYRFNGSDWESIGLYGGFGFQRHYELHKRSIAISADAIVFGERIPISGYHPRAHIFDKQGPAVQFQQDVVSLISSGTSYLEQPMQLAGDYLFVGYPFTASGVIAGVQTGSVEVYRRHDGGWQREAELSEALSNEPNQGWALAAVTNRVFVGSPRADGGVGRVRLYGRNNRLWGIRHTIESPFAGLPMEFGAALAASQKYLAISAGTGSVSSIDTNLDAVVVYSTDLDIDDDGILDTCQPDCNANNYPDDGERTIPGMVHALLHGGSTCVFDLNDDQSVDGQDIAPLMDLLLTEP